MFAGISAEGLEKGIFIGSSFRLRLRFRQYWFRHTWKFATEARRKQKRRRKKKEPIRSFRLRFRRASACASVSVFMVHTRT